LLDETPRLCQLSRVVKTWKSVLLASLPVSLETYLVGLAAPVPAAQVFPGVVSSTGLEAARAAGLRASPPANGSTHGSTVVRRIATTLLLTSVMLRNLLVSRPTPRSVATAAQLSDLDKSSPHTIVVVSSS